MASCDLVESPTTRLAKVGEKMHVRTQTVGGGLYNEHDRPPRRFPNGRVCAEHNCAGYVSNYDESEYCSLHMMKVAPRIRGKKSR